MLKVLRTCQLEHAVVNFRIADEAGTQRSETLVKIEREGAREPSVVSWGRQTAENTAREEARGHYCRAVPDASGHACARMSVWVRFGGRVGL